MSSAAPIACDKLEPTQQTSSGIGLHGCHGEGRTAYGGQDRKPETPNFQTFSLASGLGTRHCIQSGHDSPAQSGEADTGLAKAPETQPGRTIVNPIREDGHHYRGYSFCILSVLQEPNMP